MPSALVAALWVAWAGVALLLALHGVLYLALALARARLPPPSDPPAPVDPGPLPFVTVQVCVRNEGVLVEQALGHMAAFDWPRDRLEVQLLDDSDDGSQEANAAAVGRLRATGLDATHVWRPERTGFKAGALQAGLQRAKGSVLVPFDADFQPASDFLRRVVPRLGPGTACVQTRWGSRNEDANLLTRAQGLAMDGHFVAEQRVRAEAGTLMSFNATACAWSRRHLEAVGGWPAATVAEDLDLATRVHLAGGHFVYLEATAVPALLPESVRAFALQQARWARGSLQNARIHTGAVVRSRLAPKQKAGTLHHLWHYSIHPLILLLVLCQAALATLDAGGPGWLIGLTWVLPAAAATGPVAMYVVATGKLHGWRRLGRLVRMAPLAIVGLGLTPRLAAAASAGLALRRTGPFVRTRKGRAPWRPELPALACAALVVAWALATDGEAHPLGWGVLAFGACCLAVTLWPHMTGTFWPGTPSAGPMRHGLAWSIFGAAVVLVLAGFALIFAALGWFGFLLRFLPRDFDLVEVVVLALLGCLFVMAGLVGIALSMSMRMYSVTHAAAADEAAVDEAEQPAS